VSARNPDKPRRRGRSAVTKLPYRRTEDGLTLTDPATGLTKSINRKTMLVEVEHDLSAEGRARKAEADATEAARAEQRAAAETTAALLGASLRESRASSDAILDYLSRVAATVNAPPAAKPWAGDWSPSELRRAAALMSVTDKLASAVRIIRTADLRADDGTRCNGVCRLVDGVPWIAVDKALDRAQAERIIRHELAHLAILSAYHRQGASTARWSADYTDRADLHDLHERECRSRETDLDKYQIAIAE
jgi:hypothetical protein